MACAEQKLFMVREYIKMGAPVNWVSPNGFTPLYYAAGMKSPKPYYVCGSVMRRDDFGMERHWLKKGRVMGQKGSRNWSNSSSRTEPMSTMYLIGWRQPIQCVKVANVPIGRSSL